MTNLNGNECLRAALSMKVLSPSASGPFSRREPGEVGAIVEQLQVDGVYWRGLTTDQVQHD